MMLGLNGILILVSFHNQYITSMFHVKHLLLFFLLHIYNPTLCLYTIYYNAKKGSGCMHTDINFSIEVITLLVYNHK